MLRWRNLTWKHLFILLLVIAPCSVMGFHLFPVSRWARAIHHTNVWWTSELMIGLCVATEQKL